MAALTRSKFDSVYGCRQSLPPRAACQNWSSTDGPPPWSSADDCWRLAVAFGHRRKLGVIRVDRSAGWVCLHSFWSAARPWSSGRASWFYRRRWPQSAHLLMGTVEGSARVHDGIVCGCMSSHGSGGVNAISGAKDICDILLCSRLLQTDTFVDNRLDRILFDMLSFRHTPPHIVK